MLSFPIDTPDQRKTRVCIAGGGPAGMILGYLLGRCGIETLVLEAQEDFDRDFRGDTIHAGVTEILDELGLTEGLFALPHYKIHEISFGSVKAVDFRRLNTPFPYVTMVAQSLFLEFLAKESSDFPAFELEMDASVRELVRDSKSGKVTGIRYRKDGRMIEVSAELVVACDGRSSRLRKEAGLEPVPQTDPMDVLWFRLPRFESDERSGASGGLTGGRTPFIILERQEQYQIATVIAHGGYQKIRGEGLPAFHERIREVAPDLYERAREQLDDWKKIAFLTVTGSRLKDWHMPGLLLIGDAAHVMTPIGGVGINYAIWDAVEAANVLVPVLKSNRSVSDSHLAEIQSRRIRPTRMMQRIQRFAGRRILGPSVSDDVRPFRLPWFFRLFLRIPILRNFPGRLIALGWKRTRCEIEEQFET